MVLSSVCADSIVARKGPEDGPGPKNWIPSGEFVAKRPFWGSGVKLCDTKRFLETSEK